MARRRNTAVAVLTPQQKAAVKEKAGRPRKDNLGSGKTGTRVPAPADSPITGYAAGMAARMLPADNDGRNVGIKRKARQKSATISSATSADAKPSRGVAPTESREAAAWARAIEENKRWLASLDVERIEIEEAEKARDKLAKDAQESDMGYPKAEPLTASMLGPMPLSPLEKAIAAGPKPEPLFTEINPGTDWKPYPGTEPPPEPEVLPGINGPGPSPVSASLIGGWAFTIVLTMLLCTAALVLTRPHRVPVPVAQPMIVDMTPLVERLDRLRAEQATELGATNERLDATNHKLDEIIDAVKHTHFYGK